MLVGVALVAVNMAVVALYGMWTAADQWAVARAEAGGGFDPSALLPHAHLGWIVAQAAIALLLIADLLAAVAVVTLLRRTGATAGTHSLAEAERG